MEDADEIQNTGSKPLDRRVFEVVKDGNAHCVVTLSYRIIFARSE